MADWMAPLGHRLSLLLAHQREAKGLLVAFLEVRWRAKRPSSHWHDYNGPVVMFQPEPAPAFSKAGSRLGPGLARLKPQLLQRRLFFRGAGKVLFKYYSSANKLISIPISIGMSIFIGISIDISCRCCSSITSIPTVPNPFPIELHRRISENKKLC